MTKFIFFTCNIYFKAKSCFNFSEINRDPENTIFLLQVLYKGKPQIFNLKMLIVVWSYILQCRTPIKR